MPELSYFTALPAFFHPWHSDCVLKMPSVENNETKTKGEKTMSTKTATKPKQLNGVNVEELFGTIEAVKENPGLAKSQFRARGKWIDGAHNRTSVTDFHAAGEEHQHREPLVYDKDEPPVLLGNDDGGNPVEYLLVALAGCMTTSMVYHGAAKGYKIDDIQSEFEGDIDLQGFLGIDPNVRNGYQEIRVKFDIKGDLTEEQKEHLVRIAEQRSPVYDVVSHGTKVIAELKK
jgi:uncharacterized OsmC-like protein